eukprot:UN00062
MKKRFRIGSKAVDNTNKTAQYEFKVQSFKFAPPLTVIGKVPITP